MSNTSELRLSQLRRIMDQCDEHDKFLEGLQQDNNARRRRAEAEMIQIQDSGGDSWKVREALRESLESDPKMKELVHAELRRQG